MAVNTVARVRINLDASTAEFQSAMDQANAKVKAFGNEASQASNKLKDLGSHGVTGVQATSASLRVLEGNMQNNLRAAENFLAKTLGLGEALKAAFPVVGGIALLGVLGHLFEKAGEVYAAFKKLQEAPQRVAEEFQGITQPIRIANDELAVTNDKLENQIAKLQGHRQNNLQLALDEARVSADKLAQSIDRDLKEVQALLEKEEVGAFKGFFTSTASTTGLKDQFKKFREEMAQIDIDQDTALGKTSDKDAQKGIFDAAKERRLKSLDEEIAKMREAATATQKLADERKRMAAAPITTPYGATVGAPTEKRAVGGDTVDDLLAQQKESLANLLELRREAQERLRNEKDTSEKGTLEGAAKEKKRDPYAELVQKQGDELADARARAQIPVGDNLGTALAKAFAEAQRQIRETDRAMVELKGRHLTAGEIGARTGTAAETAAIEQGTKARDKQASVPKEIEEGARKIAQDMQLQAQVEDQKLQKLADENNALREQIKYAGMGPEAAWQAKHAEMARNAKTPEDQAKVLNDLLKHQDENTQKAAGIDRQTEATQRLTAAANQGLAAQRAAEEANIEASGKSQEEIDAEIKLLRERNKLQDAQTLRGASASEGARRYFSEMVDNAKSAGQEMHDVLATSFEGVNDNLTRMIAGQKASWSDFFGSLAAMIAKAEMQRMEAALIQRLFPPSGDEGGGESSGDSAGSGIAGFFGSLLKFAGFRAEGGDVDPGNAYIVGERGPELWTPPSKGTIVPNHKLGGGNVAYYTIDARGANEADVEMRVQRALVAVHGSAIRQATAMQQEARMRRPRSKM